LILMNWKEIQGLSYEFGYKLVLVAWQVLGIVGGLLMWKARQAGHPISVFFWALQVPFAQGGTFILFPTTALSFIWSTGWTRSGRFDGSPPIFGFGVNVFALVVLVGLLVAGHYAKRSIRKVELERAV